MGIERHDATLDADTRSRLGAHYTPADWARAVAARGLQPLLCWPQAMQCPACAPSVALTNLLVIDLACGDGIMLSAAADILGDLLWEAYQCEGIECDQAEARARIEAHVLWGVDIDPGAITAARAALPETEFECADALFDFEIDTAGRPTAFIMNPPYLGGGKISGTLGTAYQRRLMKEFPSSNGGADLCTYFLLQAAHLLDHGGSKGTISAICTNTISQGRTREAGLRFLLQEHRDTIYCADTNVPWPGSAKVCCSIVHLANEDLWNAISTGTDYTPSAHQHSSTQSVRLTRPTRSVSVVTETGGCAPSSSGSTERSGAAATIGQLPFDFGETLPSGRKPAERDRRRGRTASTLT